jgi:hypothetical protein
MTLAITFGQSWWIWLIIGLIALAATILRFVSDFRAGWNDPEKVDPGKTFLKCAPFAFTASAAFIVMIVAVIMAAADKIQSGG